MQDLIVTLVAIAAVGWFGVRARLRRRKPAGLACASCESHESDVRRQNAEPAKDSAVKPVTFYGGRR
jgi:hypothetical protein